MIERLRSENDINTTPPLDFYDGGGPGVVVDDTLMFHMAHAGALTVFPKGSTKEVKENPNNLKKTFIPSPVEGIYPAVVEWEGKLIMMTSSSEGTRKVYESTDTVDKWTGGGRRVNFKCVGRTHKR